MKNYLDMGKSWKTTTYSIFKHMKRQILKVAYFSSKRPKTDFHFSKAKGGPEKWGKFSYWTLK